MLNKPTLYVFRVEGDDPTPLMEVFSEIMTLAAFDVDMIVLMLGEAAAYARPGWGSEAVNGMIEALPLYGVECLYVEQESLESLPHGGALRPGVRVIARSKLNELFRACHRLIGA